MTVFDAIWSFLGACGPLANLLTFVGTVVTLVTLRAARNVAVEVRRREREISTEIQFEKARRILGAARKNLAPGTELDDARVSEQRALLEACVDTLNSLSQLDDSTRGRVNELGKLLRDSKSKAYRGRGVWTTVHEHTAYLHAKLQLGESPVSIRRSRS